MTISPPAAAWSLARQRASCSVGGLASAIDLAHPQRGLEVMLPGATVPDRLLGIELEPDCEYTEAWCRGADLTAVYETRAGGRLRATAMWRAQPAWLDASTDVWCREAIVSVQTALLEDAPRISVGADLAGSRIERLAYEAGRLDIAPAPERHAHGCLVIGPADRAVLFLAHPLDTRGVTARTAGGRVHITAQVFPAAVEKGVLLRSRVLAAIGPAHDATAPGSWVATLAAAFAASPPVLTT